MSTQTQDATHGSRSSALSSNRKAYSVDEFCAEHGISRSLFYLLPKRGNSPRTMKVGTRTLISAEAAQEWRERMERQVAA